MTNTAQRNRRLDWCVGRFHLTNISPFILQQVPILKLNYLFAESTVARSITETVGVNTGKYIKANKSMRAN
jgi:hypothetical protein